MTDYDREDALWEERQYARYMGSLLRYPDCQDPGHPGCTYCEPKETEDDTV